MLEGNFSPEGSPIINPFKRIKEGFKHFPWPRSRSARAGANEKHIPPAKGLPENPPIVQGDHYETKVESVEEDMMILCKQLKEPIENGEYGLFIGDDTSGRIPTLALKGFANFISEAFGREYVKTVFLQAGRYVPDQSVEDQFQKRVLPLIRQNSGKKALFITEHVLTGKSIQRLINMFQKYNIAIDIASLQIQRDTNGNLPFRDNPGFSSRIFEGRPDMKYATRGNSIRNELQPVGIYGEESLSGIRKRVPVSRSSTGSRVATARRDVKRLVDRIVTTVYYQLFIINKIGKLLRSQDYFGVNCVIGF